MSENQPLITVVIPVYNVEKVLRDCLESVLRQTYKNLQVIVVNDGATDASAEVLDTFTNDSRIEIYTKENGGLSSARNFGLTYAKGDFLAFVDSDDVLHPQYLEILYHILSHSGATMSRIGIQRFSKKIPQIDSFSLAKIDIKMRSQNAAISDLYDKNSLVSATVAWTKLYPRSIYKNIHFPIGRLHEDVAIALDVILQCESVAVADLPLYYYRQNPSSIMNTPNWKHIDGIDFYEEHAERLSLISSPKANYAYLAAFKTAMQCASDFSEISSNKKDYRYKKLLTKIQLLAQKLQINGIRCIDIPFVLLARISPKTTITAYKSLLKLKSALWK